MEMGDFRNFELRSVNFWRKTAKNDKMMAEQNDEN